MTIIGNPQFEIDCPVHAHANDCGYQRYTTIKNIEGSILGLCDKCGYQVEIATKFSVRYRRMDDPSVLLSIEDFERSRP